MNVEDYPLEDLTKLLRKWEEHWHSVTAPNHGRWDKPTSILQIVDLKIGDVPPSMISARFKHYGLLRRNLHEEGSSGEIFSELAHHMRKTYELFKVGKVDLHPAHNFLLALGISGEFYAVRENDEADFRATGKLPQDYGRTVEKRITMSTDRWGRIIPLTRERGKPVELQDTEGASGTLMDVWARTMLTSGCDLPPNQLFPAGYLEKAEGILGRSFAVGS